MALCVARTTAWSLESRPGNTYAYGVGVLMLSVGSVIGRGKGDGRPWLILIPLAHPFHACSHSNPLAYACSLPYLVVLHPTRSCPPSVLTHLRSRGHHVSLASYPWVISNVCSCTFLEEAQQTNNSCHANIHLNSQSTTLS